MLVLLPTSALLCGSGIFINLGRTLVLRDRVEAIRFFHNFTSATGVQDRHWASAALKLGYDTVQILTSVGVGGMPEILVARQACLSQPMAIHTCPPIELRTGEDASLRCNCSDAIPLLNCALGVEKVHDNRQG